MILSPSSENKIKIHLMRITGLKITILLFSLLAITGARADIRLPNIVSSNMVLQQNSSMKLWGWGNTPEKVVVTTSWDNRKDSTKVDGNGKWQVNIQTPAAGGPYTITIKGTNTIILQNVLIGEVWICSGQSNMEMNYNWGLPQMKEDFPTAANPNIRLFTIPKSTAKTVQERGEGVWETTDSNTIKAFSAAAYYFGRKLNKNLNVPIGLIHASWGGTPAEVWTPAEAVISDPVLNEAASKLTPSNGWPILPAYTYNAMLAPITNFPVAGAIWYQGESNTGTASTYEALFSTMINSWRKAWNKEFPFYFVQIAPYHYGNNNIAALLREAQTKTLSVPQTGMVVITDIAGDTMNIHPKDKREVGYRLANLALAETYGHKNAVVKSPSFTSFKTDKEKLIVSFENTGTGLVSKGKTVVGFYVAGADKQFYPAMAKIKDGQHIELEAKEVKEPVAARYAFSNTAAGNVFSKEGLPLNPFRTDDWTVDTSSIK
jgi:sialate O-acetylesterase